MNKILEIKFGSHLYGCDTPNSDLDFKAVYLPTAREICLGKYPKTINTCRPKLPMERNTKDDVDVEILSLDQYMKLLLEGQTMALDMLFAPVSMYTYFSDEIWIFNRIYENRMRLMNRKLNSFVGYARQQAAKYGQKGFRIHAYRATLDFLKCHPNEYDRIESLGLDKIRAWINSTGNAHIKLVEHLTPNNTFLAHIDVCGKYIPVTTTFKHTKGWLQKYFDEYGKRALLAEQNQGIDWKALSHAVRVNSEAQEVLETGCITFPRPDREILLKIKQGQIPYKEVAALIEDGLEQLKISEEKSVLPDSPDREWADEFIYEVYSLIVRDELNGSHKKEVITMRALDGSNCAAPVVKTTGLPTFS